MTEVPEPLPNPDFTRLKAYIVKGYETLDKEGYEPKDFDHYIYELAIEAVFGKDHWKWYNEWVEEGYLLEEVVTKERRRA